MEVDGGLGRPVVERKRDEAAERVQKLFQDFLEEFTITENGEKIAKYKGIVLRSPSGFVSDLIITPPPVHKIIFKIKFLNEIFNRIFK